MSDPLAALCRLVACRVLAVSFAALLMPAAGLAATTTVTAGQARFEFLTPSLVRMEYAPGAAFVDAPSVVVVKRDWPAVKLRLQRHNGWLTAASDDLTVRYRLHSGMFSPANLEVTWTVGGHAHSWHPGQHDQGNLGGMTYSLDNVSRVNLPTGHGDLESPLHDLIPGIDVWLAPAQPGLLSRSGYALIDDSATPVWNAGHTWIEPRRPTGGQDWYLFAYGSSYRAALREYAELCGPVPMIPRYALGPMVTDLNFEYFPGSASSRDPRLEHYGQEHIERELARLRRAGIPVDTLVLDFAWHDYGWDGGYDWSPLIVHPGQLLRWLHDRGFKLGLNDHPGYANTRESGLSYRDSHAPRVLADLGRRMPPRPSFDLDLSLLWQFSPGPYMPGANGGSSTRWQRVLVGLSWQAQGEHGLHGIGWYRAQVRLPERLPRRLYLYLGGVSQSYRLFVNGKEVSHSHVQWPQRLSYADVSSSLIAGRVNRIVLRVDSGGRSGGLLFGPTVIRDIRPPAPIRFNLANRKQARVFMQDLHAPLVRAGVNFWWVDGGSGAARMRGLDPQLWTNEVYFDALQSETGGRGFILARYGGWGSERYPAFFTGDTYSQWPVLAYEVAYSTRGGNDLIAYISHDIGGFHGRKIAFALYARWIEFGAFSPILRMHSAHENAVEGNLRMPWTYGARGVALMRKYFRLHTALIPYLYTYAWVAHRQALPIMRPLYLESADLEQAYGHPHEYFLGDEMLVAPVLEANGERTVYLPPGRWMDFFSGKRYMGGRELTARYAVDQTPVFVREGALIPEQVPGEYSDAEPLDPLIVNVYGSGSGRFDLYQDDGISQDYRKGAYAETPMIYRTDSEGVHHLVIGPTRGAFRGQLAARAYELRIHAAQRPGAVFVGGRKLGVPSWDAAEATALITLPKRSIRESIEVTWK